MTLAPVNPSSAVEVTTYLTKARDWLSTAVENTGPEQIAMAKAEIATAAEATKQLGLSKEIRDDAAEMVRRAEWTLRRSIKKAQETGEVRTTRDNLTPGQGNPVRSAPDDTSKASPSDFFSGPSEQRDANAMAQLDPDEFDDVIAEARAEGNLSRANVAAKSREAAGKTRAKPRRPLPDAMRDAGWDLRKAVERVQRLADDDRFSANAEQVTPHLRSHLTVAIEVCQDLLDRINN